MSSNSSIARKIERMERQLSEIKLMLTKTEKAEKKKSSKPMSISDCKSKSDLKKFTVKELKDWIKGNGVSSKKLSEKIKDELIKLVWKKLKSSPSSSDSSGTTDSSTQSSDSSESDSSESD